MSKKLITNKQHTILTLLLIFRFLNSKQIQQFLNHKDHRRINSWLKDLTDKEYVERDFKPIYGNLTKPAVFNLSHTGRKYIRETYEDVSRKYLTKLREDNTRSKGFKIKCQILADFYLAFFSEDIKKNLEDIKDYLLNGTEFENDKLQFFTSLFYEDIGWILLPRLKPDGYMHQVIKGKTVYSIVYVLDAYIPRLMLRYFLKNIFTSLEEEYWENDDIQNLQIYVICPNNMVIIYLRRALKPYFERYYGKTLLFHFATRNQIYKKLKTKSEKTGWITVSSEDEED